MANWSVAVNIFAWSVEHSGEEVEDDYMILLHSPKFSPHPQKEPGN